MGESTPHRGDHALRMATPDDVEAMQAIELDAGARFHEVGLSSIAEEPAPDPEELLGYIEMGVAWIAVSATGEPLGYIVGSELDAAAHIEQVSVTVAAGGRGIGRALIDQIERWAAAHALTSLTLTTYRDVAFNGPWYRRLGFVELGSSELTPGLAAIRREELAAGLDLVPRVAMRRAVHTA